MKVYRCLAAMLLLFAWPLSHAATTQYYYDDLGRIVQAVRSDGAVFQYQYDANGNVLAINRISAASVSIANFSPPIGHAGATVTISGTGFSATPSQNTVTFAGGAAAVVNAASATVLTVTVPQAAQTGPVSVTVNGSTATSAMNYIVRKPVIQSFAPAAVSPGGQVTVTGSNLSLVPSGTGVSVGSSAVTFVSVGNSQLIFNAPATSGSGPIHVNTSYGNTSSASNLVVVPNAIGVANVVATAELAVGGAGQAIDIAQANRSGIFTFAATQGQYLSVQLSAFVATPSWAGFTYALYSPTNAVVATGIVAASQRTIHLPRIPTSGTYLLSFSGSGTVQLTARLELNPDFTLDDGPLPVSTDFAPQSKRITFAATAGESLGVALTTLAVAPSSGNVIFNVAGPDGFFIPAYNFNCSAGAPACQMELANLPATGTYAIVVAPDTAATMSFTLRLTRHLTGTLALNTPQTIQLQSGQHTALTFNAAAGQTLVLAVSGIATVPANNWVLLRVFAPNGSQVGFFNNPTGATVNLPNLAAGTYTIFMQTFNAATATMQMTLAPGSSGAVPIDSGTADFSTTFARQQSFATFSATAGENLGLAVTNVVITPSSGFISFSIVAPNGIQVATFGCGSGVLPGCQAELPDLPLTGTYTIIAGPDTAATMSFTLRLTRHLTGTLALNTPQTIQLQSGQHTALTFNAAAGQTLVLAVSGIATVPANNWVLLRVFAPNGSQVGFFNNPTGATVNLPNLAAGTYRMFMHTFNAATATMQVTLQ